MFTGCAADDEPAEQVCCDYLNFFASVASAWRWAGQHTDITGTVLDQAAAQALGASTFGPLLDDGV